MEISLTAEKNELVDEIISSFIKSLGSSFKSIEINELFYEQLKGGSAASLYKFSLNRKSYVLRLLPQQTSTLNRIHQITLAKQAGDRGFGPKVHFVDEQMNVIIMEFIPGRTVQKSDFENDCYLTDFAKFLKSLHRSELNFPLATSPFKRFRDFHLKLEIKNSINPPRFAEVKTLMEELESIFQLFTDHVPSHLDLHPLNIMLWENRFFLVDWVNGGMCDPYFDLATFSIFHGIDKVRLPLFLTSYFGRDPTDFEFDRFIVTQPIRLFVIAFALFSSCDNNKMSYEEIVNSKTPLPSLSDFGEKGNIWPHSLLGVSMFQTALKIIDQDSFQNSIQRLKMYAQSKIYSCKKPEA